MKINLKQSTVVVVGPRVAVEMIDEGKAHVMITMAIGDGGKFVYDGEECTPKSDTFAPGTYICACTVSAYTLQSFGREYQSEIKVGGQLVAQASGTVASSVDFETDTVLFRLEVK